MNLLDDPNAAFLVLVNDEGQYSLWPAVLKMPNGWKIVFSNDRQNCLKNIAENWTSAHRSVDGVRKSLCL
jgi:MbtH protein